MSSPNYNINWEGINIPRLQVRIGKHNVTTKAKEIELTFDGIGDRTFLELNPRIFLFVVKPRRRPLYAGVGRIPKAAGFYHPVDANAAVTHGVNAKFYGGQRTSSNSITVTQRNTEWPLTIKRSDEKQIITDIEFEKYYTFIPQGLPKKELQLSDFPIAITDRYSIQARGTHANNIKRENIRGITMKFAIGVKNPNPKAGENPWVFGPMSDEIVTWIDRVTYDKFNSKIGSKIIGGY